MPYPSSSSVSRFPKSFNQGSRRLILSTLYLRRTFIALARTVDLMDVRRSLGIVKSGAINGSDYEVLAGRERRERGNKPV